MRLTLLHNPDSGEGISRQELEAQLGAAGHEVAYRSFDDDDWSVGIEEAGDLIVVAGGDGSVRKLFTALGASPTLVTLFPAGSANNIARSLGFETEDTAALLAGWEPAARSRFDLWETSARWGESRCVESVGGGLFADVLDRASEVDDEPSGPEKVQHGLELVDAALAEAEARTWTIELDGERAREQLIAFEAMNVRELGPNLPLAPEAEPGDCLLDVVLVREDDRAALAEYVAARLRGEDPTPPALDRRQARELVLEPPAGMHVDDRLPAWDDAGADWVQVRPADTQVTVLVPASAG